jgi:hypothetical protein
MTNGCGQKRDREMMLRTVIISYSFFPGKFRPTADHY